MNKPFTKGCTPWTPEEDAILREAWAHTGSLKEVMHRLPNRTYAAAQRHGIDLELGQRTHYVKPRYSAAWDAVSALLAVQSPLSVSRIAAITGFSISTVHRQLCAHRGTEARVVDYLPDAPEAPHTPYWALGSGPDKEPPRKRTKQEKNRERWQRYKKANPETLEFKAMRERLRHGVNSGKLIRRDPAAAWIGTTPNHTTP